MAHLEVLAPSATPTATPTPARATATFGETSAPTASRPALAAEGMAAAFVSQSVPAAMTAGQQYPVSVTLQNTGTNTWSAAESYRLGSTNPNNNTTWGLSRVLLAAGESVAPGQQKTFTFTVRAPAAAGTYNFQWRMLRELVAWFGAPSSNVAVAVSGSSAPPLAAAFVGQSVPAAMTAGQQCAVSVTLRNTGTNTWSAAENYRLGSTNPNNNTTWGLSRVLLAAGESVVPGQQKTFGFTVRAPAAAGTYSFQWRMLREGVAWFGASSTNVAVAVSGTQPLAAAFVSQSVPAAMTAGQPYAVSVTLRNTGTNTWSAAENYRLGSTNPNNNATWGLSRVLLAAGESVAPGQQKTFSFTVRAPALAGTYNFQWRMLRELVAWFGTPSPNVGVAVQSRWPASSLRFYGNGSGDIDRVKIPLGDGAQGRPVDVGGDFTLEFWMKAAAGNASGSCVAGGDSWINGNIIFDRDVFGGGDFGDYGVSLFGGGGRLAFGVDRLGTGTTICGAANLADGAWHHVALTRNAASGELRIFVDGQPDGAAGAGPVGDIGYDNGRPTSWPDSDPFLVIGAEKHDAGAAYPSYHGWLDEVRLSTVIRYAGPFPRPSAPFASDANTAALYHFDEGFGDAIVDTSGAAGGPSDGVRRFGGSPAAGPEWTSDNPFGGTAPAIALQTLTTALASPTSIAQAGDGRLFITEQGGAIRIWDGNQLLAAPFLSVTPISAGGEQGLLGLAFHPNYAQNGLFFVNHTNTAGDTVIARYKVSADPNLADPSSRAVLLTIDQPAANHNGGQLQFGPDGYLYIGMGDGGGACDNSGGGCNAQRDDTLLGKMLRIDVDQNAGAPPYYGIPASNPFAGPGDPPDEVWAKGLRNPWRFSFDRLTGALFIGDVGQGAREEVDLQPPHSGGGENYGWSVMEGTLCGTCAVTSCPSPPACNTPSLVLPIVEYAHASGNCAITGGYVYRGAAIPALYGKYVYGDLCSGRIWWAAHSGSVWSASQFTPTAPGLWTFGEGANGELYVARGNGTLARIVAAP